jgi:fluoroquinolone resistance protein
MLRNQTFENYQLNEDQTEFEKCVFQKSNFSKLVLDSFEFIDCTFLNCDFSMAKLSNTVFSRVRVVDCKLMGVDFSKCSRFTFSVSFDKCILNYCFFLKNNFKKTIFKDCMIKEANFSESDLSFAIFQNCDLLTTVFERNNLEGCDFRLSQNYNFNPSDNKIKKAKFSYPGVIGLLSHLNIEIE